MAANFNTALDGENPKRMAITMLGFVATFMTVGYIGPVITQTTGLTGAAIGGVQIATGIGSLTGVPAGALYARLAARKALIILFVLAGLTQMAFALGMQFDFGTCRRPS